MVRKASSVVIALVLGLTGAVHAGSVDQSDLRSEITALKTLVQQQGQELATLRAQSGETWLNERRTEEVKTLVQEVLADADTRASLLNDGMTAGHNGKNFYLASADGSFLMTISGQVQMRYVANFRDDDSDGGTDEIDDNVAGFEIRRTKLKFAGHVADPRIKYVVQLDVARDTNDVHGDIITLGYDVSDNLHVRIGEAKAPFLREEITSSAHQLAVERSYVNEYFTANVVQGIFADWQVNDMIRVSGAIHDGNGSGEPQDNKGFDGDSSDFAATARVDVLLCGEWSQMNDFTTWSSDPMGLFVGGAINYQVGETGAGTSGTTSVEENDESFSWTVDASLETAGLNLFAAFVGSSVGDQSETTEDIDPWGFVIQGGYQVIPDKLEPFVRYEHLDTDLRGVDDNELDILTVGVNWYQNKHNAKATLDVVWAFDGIPSSTRVSNAGLGLLTDTGDEEDQVAIRAQYQLLF